MMKACNVGETEQVLRIAVGSAVVMTGLLNKKWWAVLGLAPIVTGAIRYCPLNAVLGIDNCKPLSISN
jgi:hypothetical protein